jgi:demethoxyubiquinone hydroxylase (CLK1/Coq7/Cat5 family)
MQTDKATERTIEQLNSFLRGELSAVESYRQAIQKLERSQYRPTLEECARSHEDRAQLLREEVLGRGGTPAETSGAWGQFSKLVAGGATLLGDKATIYALEEGEDHERDDYRRDLDVLDPSARQLIQAKILPEQLRTHGAMSVLKKSLS